MTDELWKAMRRHHPNVDTLTIRRWDLPRNTAEKDPSDEQTAAWDVKRPTLDIAALAEMAAEYLRLFYVPVPKPARS